MRGHRKGRVRLPVVGGLALAALQFSGCAPTSHYRVNEAYRGTTLAGRSLAVFPVRDVAVENRADFEADVNGGRSMPVDSIPVEVSRLAFAAFRKCALPLRPVFLTHLDSSAYGLKDTSLVFPGERGRPRTGRFEIPVPRSGAQAPDGPDLGLQVSGLRFRREKRAWKEPMRIVSGFPGGATIVEGVNRYLVLEGVFVLWDFRAQAPIAYGRLKGEARFFFSMTRGTWAEAWETAIRSLIRHTPLGNP
jgi:hypothetical protein